MNIYSNGFFAGLDLESDLLDNFVGHFSVVMAAEEPTHRSPLNWMFYAPVKDLQLTQESLKKVHQLAQQESFGHIEIQSTGTSPIYVLNDQPNTNECIAISAMHRHLVVVQSPVNRCAETMQRIDQGGKLFTEHLDDTVKNQFKSGVPTYAHVDVDHLLDWMATEDDSMAFAPWRALLASINECLVRTWLSWSRLGLDTAQSRYPFSYLLATNTPPRSQPRSPSGIAR